ncbi:hypothetical protein CPC08DRAFT_792752 [Agrocybe pediades]|nr:hypothetical protein CPC08DRAFT_792752 [Agrocybe pediades]
MPLRPSIDDLNTTLIEYNGDWQTLIGSSRQWESSVHSTIEPGATATFRFRGYQVWVWGTIPAGTGSNLIDIAIDDESPTRITRKSNGSAVFNEPYFESPMLRDTFHKVVITNRGSNADQNTEFMLDRFEFETSEEIPLFAPASSSQSPTSSSQTQTPTSSPNSTIEESSSGSKTPVGAITGAVIGVLALLVLILGFLLWRRRRNAQGKHADNEKPAPCTILPNQSVLEPTPFPIDDVGTASAGSASHPSNASSSDSGNRPVQGYTSEKARLQNALQSASNSGQRIPSSMSVPRTMPSTTSLATSTTPLSPNAGSISMYTNSSTHPDATMPRIPAVVEAVSAETVEPFDNSIPPPSYWQNERA